MPPYYRRYYRNRWKRTRRYPWTRRRPRFWRFRQTIRRRRPLHRRKYRVRKRLFKKKKLKYLILKEFQPKKIRKCRIKGIISLFESGPHRLHREWTNHMNSFYPPHSEGGGGWSQMQFSLESLFEQYELVRNKWTQSNVLMPLCRYTGCTIKLYRTAKVDYICNYSICLPMKTTKYQHTNAQPSNMLLYPKKILVPSLERKPRGKLYIKKKIRLPEQYSNKWYFQVDLYKQPLLLLTTSACNFDRWFLNPNSISNNITINTLNTDFFQSHNFRQYGLGTQQWQPKPNHYLYATLNGSYTQSKVSDLIFLGQTMRDTLGQPINNETWQNYSNKNKIRDNFGNIFSSHYLTKTRTVYISQKPPTYIFDQSKRNYTLNNDDLGLAVVTQDLYKTVRYNPERDKGHNKAWLVSTSDNIYGWHEPDDPDLIYEGFPLWALLWGWIDFLIKLKKPNKVEDLYTLVIKTDQTYPVYDKLVLIDDTFINGYSPWQDQTHTQFVIDEEEWHPKVKYQERQIENICETGPGTAKTSTQSIEAHCGYCFYFKWGGCPNELENITNPGAQTHYPVPNQELQGPEIQDPKWDPTKDIWPWDVRRQMLTKKGTKRITDYKEIEMPSFTGSKLSTTATSQTTLQKVPTQDLSSTEEEEETTSEQIHQQQLDHLKRKQHKLRLQLKQIISQTVNLKY
nr:MAG: ORF1 [TTV-like mini virus]